MARESNWTKASRGEPVDMRQTVQAILDAVREHYTLTGSFPTVDQILDRLLRP